jgi:hypothetical protein
MDFDLQDESRYGSFRAPAAGPAALDVRVRLEAGAMPDDNGQRKIFDSGESWSMFAREKARRVRLQPPSLAAPLWSADFALDGLEAAVYCGSLCRRPSGRLLNPVNYPLDLLLSMYMLAPRGGAIVHAAGVDLGGKGLLFPGRSGAGKSTLARLLAALPEARFLSDDRVIVRKIGGQHRVFGTPWLGSAGVGDNRDAPLSAILFLRQSPRDAVHPLSPKEAVERLLPLVSAPWYDPEAAGGVLGCCEAVAAEAPAFELGFTPTAKAADRVRAFAAGLSDGAAR